MASWSKLTYSRRLFLWLLLYSLLLVGCFVSYQYGREREFKAMELDSRLQPVNQYILGALAEGDTVSLPALDRMHPFADMRVTVMDRTGRVIYDNSLDTLPGANHLDRAEIRSALQSGSGYAVRRHSATTGNTYFYSARRGPGGMVVRTAVPYTLSLTELLRADLGFLWFMIAVTTVMCTLGFFATRRLGQNLSRLSLFARSAERGERISDTEPFPHDELGDISNHIVSLYVRLQEALAERDREHSAAMREQMEKERIKKELTNNINHELKTPVAAIRVCVETLLAHDNLPDSKRREFLMRCMEESDRLQRLLDDVSLITRMDHGSANITREQLDLAEIIDRAVADVTPSAQAAGITVTARISRPLLMTGNQSLLSSIFHNLLVNAVAYSGGKHVTVTQNPSAEGEVSFTVFDDGCGVPVEHLSRLFERFYRVDKGRSRAAGGTGLGLAIVKNAVLFHGGSITARREPGGGLAFDFFMKT